MELRILAVGDVVGDGGLQCLERHLRSLKKLYRIDFCVVNGENASGTGLTARDLRVSGRLLLYPAARKSAAEPAGARLRRV